MRRRLLALSTTCAIIPAVLDAQLPPGRAVPLESRIEWALGARPAACGIHEVSIHDPRASVAALRQSVACVLGHAARKTSAWTAVRGGGIDSDIATGLMVGADGVIRYFHYDSDHLNASDGRSPLSEQPCQRVGVVETPARGAYFSCEG